MTQSPEDLDISSLSIENDIETQQHEENSSGAEDETCTAVPTTRIPKMTRTNDLVRQYLRDNVAVFCKLDDLRIKVTYSLALVAR